MEEGIEYPQELRIADRPYMCVQVEGCCVQVGEGVCKEEAGEGVEKLEQYPLEEGDCHGENQEPAKDLIRSDELAKSRLSRADVSRHNDEFILPNTSWKLVRRVC